ncbi:MAG: SMI1/KNR4 family protein [Clostridiales bacterium]|jgi:hypothetical protein|nr:SMI1/KNR4 family protein [Clostridiales bacterium]
MMSLERIRQKLNILKELDTGLDIFGSGLHKYILNPVLTDGQITAFEEKNSIRLPGAYREYLLHIGNGGAGPFYGLYQLGHGDGIEVNLSKPFPFSSGECLKVFDVYEQVEEKLAALNIEDEADEMQEKLFNEITGDINCGFVFLCTEGCGMNSILIVNGEAAGTVWYYDMANDAGVFPLMSPTTKGPMAFYEWFEIWLDSSIGSIKNGTNTINGYAGYIIVEEP